MMKPSFVARVHRRVSNYEQLLRDLGVEEGAWGSYRRTVRVSEGIIGRYESEDISFVRSGVGISGIVFDEYWKEEKQRLYRKLLYLKMFNEGRVDRD